MAKGRKRFFSGLDQLRQTYTWQTADVDISIMAQHFSRLFRYYGFCHNDLDEANLRLGLEEVLINAVEHGNLELRSKDRSSDMQNKDKYEDVKRQRYRDPRFCKRKLILDLEINRNTYVLSIRDEGRGFDVSRARKVLEGKTSLTESEISTPGGKGFWIIKNLFPSINFVEGGRRIILSNKTLNQGG